MRHEVTYKKSNSSKALELLLFKLKLSFEK